MFFYLSILTTIFQVIIEAKDDGGGGDNWTTGAISRASSSHIITTNKATSSFLHAGCPSSCPTNSVTALKGKYHIPWTCLPQAYLLIFQILTLSDH